MNQRWLWIFLGAIALIGVLLAGIIIGAGAAFLLFNVNPARAALEVEISPIQETSTQKGVLIAEVVPGSPAEQAGLMRGDIILKFAGQEVNSLAELAGIVRDREPGDRVELEVRHGTDQLTITVELGEENGKTYLGIRACRELAFGVFPPGSRALPLITREPGFLIRRVISGSPADKAGLKAGDQITAIDGEPVRADRSLAEIIHAHQPGDEITFEVLRRGEDTSRQITVVLGEDPETEGQAYLGVEYLHIPGIRIRSFDQDKFPFRFHFQFPWPDEQQPFWDESEA